MSNEFILSQLKKPPIVSDLYGSKLRVSVEGSDLKFHHSGKHHSSIIIKSDGEASLHNFDVVTQAEFKEVVDDVEDLETLTSGIRLENDVYHFTPPIAVPKLMLPSHKGVISRIDGVVHGDLSNVTI
ncbi:MAG: hypothetical protein ACOCQD_05455, partial [archaeon]